MANQYFIKEISFHWSYIANLDSHLIKDVNEFSKPKLDYFRYKFVIHWVCDMIVLATSKKFSRCIETSMSQQHDENAILKIRCFDERRLMQYEKTRQRLSNFSCMPITSNNLTFQSISMQLVSNIKLLWKGFPT